ncbi:glycosyltransferase [Pacificimonas flava]|uniref:glycosyltransferase n=1 Tax=Pacificimonas flava TaxID=1234595 RepID=UPI00160C0313|nr:glycosyltransferase family 2 protein [Pacificimonas flava]MBB5281209.1 hypothetical protein [Pacificimonas flava]
METGRQIAVRAQEAKVAGISYVLPIAATAPRTRQLTGYLLRLARELDDVIVVDGSPDAVFEAHTRAWGAHVRHVRPQFHTPNGKVAGVVTGVQLSRYERVVIGDDDIRYRRSELARLGDLLLGADVVRPQNWFRPAPWHARWDTARTLFARLSGGDWPGTLGVRRSVLLAAGGYAGDVLFENLELVRTIKAGGGREMVPLDLFVVRRPPSFKHFSHQRVRQAYDEWARPLRLAATLAILPGAIVLTSYRPRLLVVAAAASCGVAELGRRRAGGASVFPPSSALWAPLWLLERSITSWLALVAFLEGGVRYRGSRLQRSATSLRRLRSEHSRSRDGEASVLAAAQGPPRPSLD